MGLFTKSILVSYFLMSNMGLEAITKASASVTPTEISDNKLQPAELEKPLTPPTLEQLAQLEAALTPKEGFTRPESMVVSEAIEQFKLSNNIASRQWFLSDDGVINITSSMYFTAKSSAIVGLSSLKERAPIALIISLLKNQKFALEAVQALKSLESKVILLINAETTSNNMAIGELLYSLPASSMVSFESAIAAVRNFKEQADKLGAPGLSEVATRWLGGLEKLRTQKPASPETEKQSPSEFNGFAKFEGHQNLLTAR